MAENMKPMKFENFLGKKSGFRKNPDFFPDFFGSQGNIKWYYLTYDIPPINDNFWTLFQNLDQCARCMKRKRKTKATFLLYVVHKRGFRNTFFTLKSFNSKKTV